MTKPRVKPLVWEESINIWTAKTILGEYIVGFDDGWWCGCELSGPVYWDWDPPEDRRSYYGPFAFIAAAQADYEARILSALDRTPDPAVQALVGALRCIRNLPDEIEEQVKVTRAYAADSGMDRNQIVCMEICTSHFLDHARTLRAALSTTEEAEK